MSSLLKKLEQYNREREVGQADEVIMNESEDELHDGSRQQDVPTKTAEIEKPSPKPERDFSRHPNSRTLYLSGKDFLLFSMLTLAFLQMGIIEAEQVIE